MAILFIDGCDIYAAAAGTTEVLLKWDTAASVRTTAAAQIAGRFGGGSIDFTSSGTSYVGKSVNSLATVICGGAYKNASSTATQIFEFRNSTSSQFTVNKNATGQLELRRGATILATSTNVLAATTTDYRWIECRLFVDGSAGTCEVRVDGVAWVSVSAANTKNAAGSGVTEVRFMGFGNWDDMYIADINGVTGSGFLGDCRVSTLAPEADVQAQFTRSTGATNAGCVDDVPNTAETDYVESSTPAQKDIYALADLTSNPTVLAVQAVAMARKDDAGERSVRLGLSVSGTETQSAAIPLLTTYRHLHLVSEVCPSTGAAWTAANVNAANLSVECV